MSKWLHILETIGPAALAFTPAAPFIPAVIAGVKLAEAKGGTGAEKKAIALDAAKKVAQGVNAVTADHPLNEDQLAATVGTAIDTVVGVVNLTHKAA